ncbi:Transglutaminase-like superfamily protein [Adhaeretor mobilis]|uniref:Transglutaminase-like superfamily protein n=2 Tax=Adhaeretor mobilis TaxID=1930276 RepID=A0A517MTK0_9BACT|nr:Transglutaminase-like superfamily protein [Adhaeretor mobilis]
MLAAVMFAGNAQAQIATQAAEGNSLAKFGETFESSLRVGVKVDATRGAVKNIHATIPVPINCPEQEVLKEAEDITADVQGFGIRDVKGGEAQQLVVSIPRLNAGAEARAILTYRVRTKTILPPEETDHLVVPKKVQRDQKMYLGRSKNIDVNHRKIRDAVKEALAEVSEDATAWERIEALYDFAFDKIEYVEGENISSVEALKLCKGDCQAVSVLFVAMCRTEKIPARMVWAHEHQYAEFYLEDEEQRGQWFPIESAGTKAFGEMPIARIIMQKGDNFTVPEKKRERLNYATDYLIGLPTPGGGKPKVKYLREVF